MVLNGKKQSWILEPDDTIYYLLLLVGIIGLYLLKGYHRFETCTVYQDEISYSYSIAK
jgi:hypothetical protein